jgi:competence protein ComEC
LGSAFLVFLAVDPGGLGSVGFQLSFAGTAGLVLLRGPVSNAVDRALKALTGGAGPGGGTRTLGNDLVKGGVAGIAAGISATLPTLPLLAWHFDRISLAGIPATLVVAPAVAAAIPGIGASLLLSLVGIPLGRFVAGGTGLLLDSVAWGVRVVSQVPGASVWVSRPAVVVAVAGGTAVYLLVRRGLRKRVRPAHRTLAASGAGMALVLLLPLLPGGRQLEIHLIDVGQGDAIALRSPRGRWILVDAGPRSARFDAGTRRVLPYLRRQGVRRLEVLVLTHPHLDHIGGAPSVMEEMEVRGVMEPSRPYASAPYFSLLESAHSQGLWWWIPEAGRSFELDGVQVEVLHPDLETRTRPNLDDPNDLSVVLLVRWGEATVLLTGDAGAEVERGLLSGLPPLTVLKVGHHGSRTSTSSDLLAVTRPSVALIGVGDPNGVGHPHDPVLPRLEELGTRIFRSDRDGDVRVRVGPDGGVEVRTAR